MYLPCMSLMLFHVFALHALVFCCHASRFTDESDKHALLDFQSNLLENSQVVLASWNDSFALCKWTGVICGRKHKRVTGLHLSGMKLIGVISPSIGNLSFLKSLTLAENSFHGSIPLEIGKLFRLRHLNLSNNILGGGIPRTMSNCSALFTSDLSSNNLEHEVPFELGSLSLLFLLSLKDNNLTGNLPSSIGNLTSLNKLDLEYNHMEGEIPESMSRLTRMKFFRIAANNFSGRFPHAIWNLSSLMYLSIPDNSFYGKLRPDIDQLFPEIQVLYLSGNDFEGEIPSTLVNITTLHKFEIKNNHMRGSIPSSFGRLHHLEILGLSYNSLGSYSSKDLDFLINLNNCSQLRELTVGYNKLGGNFPTSIANLSNQLTDLVFGGNLIYGTIPIEIGNLESLQAFQVEQNMLTGELPISLGKLTRLQSLYLHSNSMSGDVPSSLGNLTMISHLYLSNNSFKGSIPSNLRNSSYLLYLSLASNRLHGAIPQELMEVQSMVFLDLSDNRLTGHFPGELGNLTYLLVLDVSHNQLSGNIPQTLGSCLSMEDLSLRGNFFEGAITVVTKLRSLKFLDISNNNFSGIIPRSLVNLSLIQSLNLSVNNLEGAVPTEGAFGNSSAVSIFGNKNLCGGIPGLQLKPCFMQEETKTRKKIAIGVGTGVALILFSIMAVLSLCWFKKQRKKNKVSNINDMDIYAIAPLHERVQYKELHNATGGFSLGNMIGSGNFGVVYKGFLGLENRVVAIKVLNLKKRGAAKSFIAECEALKGVRHRNLVKLVTACSSIDYKGNEFKALVYDFMPNGSLDMWLHQEEQKGTTSNNTSRPLTLFERFNIVIDVAYVLDYLHVHCHEPIAHCDLKPNNILLDDDLTAHVSDFGLARLHLKFDEGSFLNQLSSAGVNGTIGYTAPEYGMGGQPSIHGDVYSYGVLLLETFTGKRPTNELFGGDCTLCSYTKSALPDRVLEIADKSIFHSGLRLGFPVAECLKLVLELGLRCCEDSPTNRLPMSVVVRELISLRQKFFRTRRTTRR